MNEFYAAHQGRTLITDKHNPRRIRLQTYSTYRTVVSDELAQDDNIMDALHDGRTRFKVYFDCMTNHSSLLYVTAEPIFIATVPASGVAAGAIVPVDTCDRLALIKGSNQGWHSFGEQSVTIQHWIDGHHLIQIDEW